MRIFFRYFSPKNKSVAPAMHGFFGKNYRKNLTPKITRLINTRYLIGLNTGLTDKIDFELSADIKSVIISLICVPS